MLELPLPPLSSAGTPRALPAVPQRSLNCSAEKFDGDLTADPRIAGAIDFAHTASTNWSEDLVPAKRSWSKGLSTPP